MMKGFSKLTLLVCAIGFMVSCNQQPAAETEADANEKAREEMIVNTTKEWFDALDSGDYEWMKSNLAPNFFRTVNGEQQTQSADEYIENIKNFRTAIPDLKFEYQVVAVTENQLVQKWTATGTSSGPLGNVPGLNQPCKSHSISIFTYDNEGKPIGEEVFMNHLTYLSCWGYTMAPPAPAN